MSKTKKLVSPERERESRSSSKRRVVWALYDDGNCSYKKAIKKFFPNDFKVYCFGINKIPKAFEGEKSKFFIYKPLDLSLTNPSLFSYFKQNKIPNPDIILASPPCESWSGADCAGKMFMGFDKNGRWIVKNSEFYENYNKKCHPVKHRFFEQKERSRIIGENTIAATIFLIKKFPKCVWVIENPMTSKIWDYQKKHLNFNGIETKTFYSAYDKKYSAKPTIFKSNINLNLRKIKGESNSRHMGYGSYDTRSSIPEDLVKDIVLSCKKYLKGGKK